MFKKTMEFDNLEGETVTQTFYFNYNKKEVAELMEFGAIQKYADPTKTYLPLEEQLKVLSTPTSESGLSEVENNRQAYDIFQNLILDAYGVKEADGVTFTKNAAIRESWSNHVAFVEMIFEFLENPQLAATFVEQCLPAKLVAAAKDELQKEAQAGGAKLSSETISEMVEEAARRQADPATRIEPGIEAAKEALGIEDDAPVLKLAEQLADSTSEEIPLELLTEQDIATMSDEAFEKLDVQKLSKPQMLAAFRRKSKS